MTVEEYIGKKVMYDVSGQLIFSIDTENLLHQILDIRGWGRIQNLCKNEKGNIDFKKAEEFQDAVGEWITDAINQKLNKPK